MRVSVDGIYITNVADEIFQVRRVLPELQDSQVLLVQVDFQVLLVLVGSLDLAVRKVQRELQEELVQEEVLDLQAAQVSTVKVLLL